MGDCAQLRWSALQAERQKDAAIKAAQARAAADYKAEVAQLNAMKLASEARINEKVKKSKQRARKKEDATTVEEVRQPEVKCVTLLGMGLQG